MSSYNSQYGGFQFSAPTAGTALSPAAYSQWVRNLDAPPNPQGVFNLQADSRAREYADVAAAYNWAKLHCNIEDGRVPAFCKFHIFNFDDGVAVRLGTAARNGKPYSVQFNLRVTMKKSLDYSTEVVNTVRGARPVGFGGTKDDPYKTFTFYMDENPDTIYQQCAEVAQQEWETAQGPNYRPAVTATGAQYPIFIILRNGNDAKFNFERALKAYKSVQKKLGVNNIWNHTRAVSSMTQELMSQSGSSGFSPNESGLFTSTPAR